MSRKKKDWKKELYIIIFEADTFWGKFFDVALLIAILLSVIAVMLESVEKFQLAHGELLYIVEWVFTILFSLEYIARVYITEKKMKYVFSFFGIIDLLALLPAFISLFIYGAQSLLILRSIRLLRVFRILKMVRFLGEASQLGSALKASRHKITVFIGSVFILVVLLGTLMYLIEGRENGFTSIPISIYWAIVTLTTVGYGDIAPQTVIGQAIASLVMILGYGIIAVPTGIVTSEMTKSKYSEQKPRKDCNNCHSTSHDEDAKYCKMCGHLLS